MENVTIIDLKKLVWPKSDSHKGENGQLTIIGGSSLFHGAPLLALKTASRLVDMTFFSSPEPTLENVVKIKSGLSSFIWVDWEKIGEYLQKSDAILIGSGMMRAEGKPIGKDTRDLGRSIPGILSLKDEGEQTYFLTKYLLEKFPKKKWIIDAGALQMMEPEWIPQDSILTPNQKEFSILFEKERILKQVQDDVETMAQRYNCTILLKGKEDIIGGIGGIREIRGGNAGMTKGGTGDVLAGLVAGLACKNDLFLAACAGSYLNKKAGEELFKKRGFMYNADDLAEEIPLVFLRELCKN